jgi:hypothetical protein
VKKLIAFSCVAALYGAATAFAEPILIQNHSFEDADLASGAWSNCIDVVCGEADPDYWINPIPGTDTSNTNTAFSEVIDGFTADGITHVGIDTDEPFMQVAQNLGVPVEPNTTYTLTVAIGNRDTGFSPEGSLSGIALLAGGIFFEGEELGLTTFPAGEELGASEFTDIELVVTTESAVPPGDLYVVGINLGINEDASAAVGRSHFDNFRLDATPILTGLDCDFDANETCDIVDLDLLLYTGQAQQILDPYDLNSDGVVNLADRDEWYTLASAENGVELVAGDTNLDGLVVSSDLNALGSNWQTTNATSVAQGDFNGDGFVNATDLNPMGVNWQHGVAAAANTAVPEPSGGLALLTSLAMWVVAIRRRSKS